MRAFGTAVNWLATLVITIVALPIVYNIVLRALGHPTIWTFEVTLYSVGASAFLANAVTLREGSHFRIQFLPKLLPGYKKPLDWLALLATMLVGAVLAAAGVMYAYGSFVDGARSSTLLSVPLFIPQTEIALGGIALFTEALSLLLSGGYESAEHGGK